jgi:hypothetical protein
MHIINESQVSEEHRKSPKGSYELFRKHISLALGGVKDVGPWGGGHPFKQFEGAELELDELKKAPPYLRIKSTAVRTAATWASTRVDNG